MISGIPELDLPIAEKQFLDKQELSVGSNVLNVKITLQNVTALGMAHVKYSKIELAVFYN